MRSTASTPPRKATSASWSSKSWAATPDGSPSGAASPAAPTSSCFRKFPSRFEKITDFINRRDAQGYHSTLVVVAEGAHMPDGEIVTIDANCGGEVRLGGIGERVAAKLQETHRQGHPRLHPRPPPAWRLAHRARPDPRHAFRRHGRETRRRRRLRPHGQLSVLSRRFRAHRRSRPPTPSGFARKANWSSRPRPSAFVSEIEEVESLGLRVESQKQDSANPLRPSNSQPKTLNFFSHVLRSASPTSPPQRPFLRSGTRRPSLLCQGGRRRQSRRLGKRTAPFSATTP